MSPLPVAVLQAVVTSPAAFEIFLRLAGRLAGLRIEEPVGFFHGLFDPSKAEANAAALVSAGLDALLVQQDVELLKLQATLAQSNAVAATIPDAPVESPPYDR